MQKKCRLSGASKAANEACEQQVWARLLGCIEW
jgi:hypothetical protein